MNIYLCSRVAIDAHAQNNLVAKALRDAGYTVFVPHEQHYNQIIAGFAETVPDVEIYTQDSNAMKESALCVIVGRIGVDCGYEVGYFQGRNIPCVWFCPDPSVLGRHPMLYTVTRVADTEGLLRELTVRTQGVLAPVMDCNEIGALSLATATKLGFYETPRSPLEFHALIHSEVSEATEAVRIGQEGNCVYSTEKGKPEGELIELADIILRTSEYAISRGYNLSQAVLLKNAYNQTREYRNGGKKL